MRASTSRAPDEVDGGSLTYAGIFFALYLVAHIVFAYAAPYADPELLPLVAMLTAIGETNIYRLGPEVAPPGPLDRDRRRAVRGALCAIRRDCRIARAVQDMFGVTAILVLMLAAMPGIGQTVNGARLWMNRRVPDPARRAGEDLLIIFLAGYLRDKREVLAQGRLKRFGPLLLICGAAMLLLVRTNDLGIAPAQYGIVLAMVYVATGRGHSPRRPRAVRRRHRFATRTPPRSTSASRRGLTPGRRSGLLRLPGELALRQDSGSFQIVQCLYSIGDGGIGGTGLGAGSWSHDSGNTVIPYAQTDFITRSSRPGDGLRRGGRPNPAIYVLFAWRGLKIAAVGAGDGFSKLLAVGLTFAFCFQAFVIIGGVTKLVNR